MKDNLSIRSYSTKPTRHSHDFFQLVMPLRGVISIRVEQFRGNVAPGECVVVRKTEEHMFTANAQAKFVVADLQELPANVAACQGVVFAINASMSRYLAFVEQQLELQINAPLETSMVETFYLLLSEQTLLPKLDSRIANAMMFIEKHLDEKLTISQLASVACLSDTQFKLLFKQHTGLTAMSYITKLRMEKAQALLTHTDYSLQHIGERVGFAELSTFSRKFSRYFGLSPTQFKQ
ncbi:helix-turn-helix domain-containing protein [Alteromonas ponticola]|uniref:Helix-turn-helix transcriptional regulator n=1 Tax=Alteromonas ponticola TaxID=2720613 RepID=A0ABX1R5N0_9ALTE|nr:helix-turn-helix transcriptional regulator [Alteromonas ponticola]